MNVSIFLPVWKQGDDLSNCIKDDHPSEAFRRLAERYEVTSYICRDIAKTIEAEDCCVDGDTHCIFIDGLSEDKANELIEIGCADVSI